MNHQPQLTAAKLTSALVTLLPAAGMGFILYYFSALLQSSKTGISNPLITALINMTIFGMVAVIYFFAIGSINAIIFRFIGRTERSRWPKKLAYAGGAIIWAYGIATSLSMFIKHA